MISSQGTTVSPSALSGVGPLALAALGREGGRELEGPTLLPRVHLPHLCMADQDPSSGLTAFTPEMVLNVGLIGFILSQESFAV